MNHPGVFMTVNPAIGMITPPAGLDIFMASDNALNNDNFFISLRRHNV